MIKYWSEKNKNGNLREFSFDEQKNSLEIVCYQSYYYNYSDKHVEPDGGPYLRIGSIFKIKDVKNNIIVINKIVSHVQDKNGNLFIKMETRNL